jgi:hypothetical protein
VRLLLDEHLSPDVAGALRHRGHDVDCVTERAQLRGRPDVEILTAAAAEGRVVVTENVGDFASLGSRRLPSRKPHHGVVLVPRRKFPGSADAFGLMIRALDALLVAHPGEDDLVGDVVWLGRVDVDLA